MNTAKTAIVTGASHGIGQMTALKLAAAGYDLAICCQKDMTALSAVAKQITANGRNCLAMQCDVGDSAQVADFSQYRSHTHILICSSTMQVSPMLVCYRICQTMNGLPL